MDLYIIIVEKLVDNLCDSTIYLISHLAFDLPYYRMICTIIWRNRSFLLLLIQFIHNTQKKYISWDISIKYCTNAINCLSLFVAVLNEPYTSQSNSKNLYLLTIFCLLFDSSSILSVIFQIGLNFSFLFFFAVLSCCLMKQISRDNQFQYFYVFFCICFTLIKCMPSFLNLICFLLFLCMHFLSWKFPVNHNVIISSTTNHSPYLRQPEQQGIIQKINNNKNPSKKG